jgi:hypothetical protein
VWLSVPVEITGKRYDDAAFSERTTTVAVGPHGALILLQETVAIGQTLTIRNMAATEKMGCFSTGNNGVPEVGVEFTHACSRFWRVAFPPVDWTPRSPEAKRLVALNTRAETGVPTTPGIQPWEKK